MQPLPIDPLVPAIVSALRRGSSVAVEAPPGAGKTTRVPRAVFEASLAGEGEVLVLEPRRLAARLAARRVAAEIGERVGETVGYQVRFEEAVGPKTRIRYVTEGLLTRRLVSQPTLPGVGVVVLDEFHERHWHGDLALAFLRRLRDAGRPDLKLVVMSATLDTGPVADFLGAPVVRSEGRAFEVSVEYLSPAEAADPRAPLSGRVAKAVRRLVDDGLDGDILVFLPGMAEIRRAMEACAEVAARAGLDLVPLHGDLPPEEQDRAVLPGRRRKVILSTNVAETSVTIEGVTAVVDSGLARVASHSPWTGLPRLEVRPVSKASAAQRAGRAGRTRPGRAIRLYTRRDHDARPGFDRPEILREDLAEAMLVLSALGATDIRWLDAPPAAAADAAKALLRRLGATTAGGEVTELGRRMLRYPLHPRLARLLVEAQARGAAGDGALVAALLAERDIRERTFGERRRGDAPSGPSDLLELARLFDDAARVRFAPDTLRSLGLSPSATAAVERSRRQLLGLLRPEDSEGSRRRSSGEQGAAAQDTEEALLLATLAAFPDRVARRRAPRSRDVVLAAGGSARLDVSCAVRDSRLLVAVDAGEQRADSLGSRVPGAADGRGVTVRLASAVTPEMLLELFPDSLRWEEEVAWNAAAQRAEGWERLLYDDLVIEEGRKAVVDPGRAAALLAEAAVASGARTFAPEGAVDRLLGRMEFVARTFPESGVTPFAEDEMDAALRRLCAGRRSFTELKDAGFLGALLGSLAPSARALLDRMAPERISLPGGRAVKIRYEPGGKPPHVESRLQDFFGLEAVPAIAGGRVPLVVHLLAPNMRAVQVTDDLAGFWERHYPTLRRELMRRYPRHAWPEDPLRASPPSPRR